MGGIFSPGEANKILTYIYNGCSFCTRGWKHFNLPMRLQFSSCFRVALSSEVPLTFLGSVVIKWSVVNMRTLQDIGAIRVILSYIGYIRAISSNQRIHRLAFTESLNYLSIRIKQPWIRPLIVKST